MNTRIKFFEPSKTDTLTTPPAFVAAYQELVPVFATMMRFFGIARITTTHNQLGMSGLLNVAFDKLPGPPPPAPYEASQRRVARWLADGMQIVGITGVELNPSADDLKVIQAGWAQLAQAAPTVGAPQLQPALTPKMPPAVDPTNEVVLDRLQ